jgi:hypothetical protein
MNKTINHLILSSSNYAKNKKCENIIKQIIKGLSDEDEKNLALQFIKSELELASKTSSTPQCKALKNFIGNNSLGDYIDVNKYNGGVRAKKTKLPSSNIVKASGINSMVAIKSSRKNSSSSRPIGIMIPSRVLVESPRESLRESIGSLRSKSTMSVLSTPVSLNFNSHRLVRPINQT